MSGEEYGRILEQLISLSARCREFLEISDESIRRLRTLREVVLQKVDRVISGVLRSLLADSEAAEIIRRAGLSRERAAKLLTYWYTTIFEGNYDEDHARKVFRIGLAHARVGVPQRLMVLTSGVFMRETLKLLGEVEGSAELLPALSSCMLWNLCLMLESYELARRLSMIKAAGISEKLYERLISLRAKEVYDKLAKLISLEIPA